MSCPDDVARAAAAEASEAMWKAEFPEMTLRCAGSSPPILARTSPRRSKTP